MGLDSKGARTHTNTHTHKKKKNLPLLACRGLQTSKAQEIDKVGVRVKGQGLRVGSGRVRVRSGLIGFEFVLSPRLWSNSKFEIRNSKFEIQNSKFEIRNLIFKKKRSKLQMNRKDPLEV